VILFCAFTVSQSFAVWRERESEREKEERASERKRVGGKFQAFGLTGIPGKNHVYIHEVGQTLRSSSGMRRENPPRIPP
jgi:hypothetical protein